MAINHWEYLLGTWIPYQELELRPTHYLIDTGHPIPDAYEKEVK